MWALTISVHTQPPLPLGHVDGFKASNFIHKHTTEMVPGLQLILWVCDHVLALARQWTWFVLSHNGTSAYCDQLTPPAVRILSLEPTSLVWKNTSVYVCACVCVCVCTPPCLEYSVYVCIRAGLYYCSLGKATFFVRKKKKKTTTHKTNLEMTLHLFLCIHTKCPWCLFCAIHISPCSTRIPFSVLVSSQSKECMTSELPNVPCAHCARSSKSLFPLPGYSRGLLA